MSIISFCVLVIELADEDTESRPLKSLTFTSQVYDEMSSKGKGIPVVPNHGNRGKSTGLRKPQEFRISTFASAVSKEENLSQTGDISVSTETKHFVSGNPFVEVTKGVLHLYKDNDRLYMEPNSTAPRSEMLCVMAIPSSTSCTDFLTFVSPFKSMLEHIKIVRDNSPNHYMALLKFTSQVGSDTFYREFNGKKYNSFDDTICLLAYVSRVETLKHSDGAGLPLTGHTELPTCPVCLERMDESIDGLLTILCNHSFHASCLIQWSDNGCPVCRYVQTPEMVTKNVCVECNAKEQLWICLICGHVGCGRYLHGHAYKHFCETEHVYAIQPDNNRVWDYVGDNFVHRLFQNKGDGKLVDSPSGRRYEGDDSGHELEDTEDKMDNMQLEFTHMLTSQLEAQRNYFEERIKQGEADKKAHLETVIAKLDLFESDKADYESKLKETLQEKKELEKKLAKANSKYERTKDKLDEQLALNKAMNEDLNFCKKRLLELEKKYEDYRLSTQKEIKELNETIRDLSVYIETEKVISDSPFAAEVRQGTVSVPTPVPSNPTSRKKKHAGK